MKRLDKIKNILDNIDVKKKNCTERESIIIKVFKNANCQFSKYRFIDTVNSLYFEGGLRIKEKEIISVVACVGVLSTMLPKDMSLKDWKLRNEHESDAGKEDYVDKILELWFEIL